MNPNILKPQVQCFIAEHLQDDVTRIALSKSPFPDVTSKELAEQISGKKRVEKKLPLWFKTEGIYYPPKIAIEQTSSEATAKYKSKLALGNTLIDLTGGLGVDSFFFSQQVSTVIHCEQNAELSRIASHNISLLGIENILFITTDGIEYLKTQPVFDTLYIDPSRRIESQKVFLLKDTEPDVVSNLPLLLSKARRIIIKNSPLFDIQSGLKELKNVSEIHVVSVKNDCKELLWVIDRDFQGEPEIICTTINESEKTFKFKLSDERNAENANLSVPLKYVFEPDVALLKAGCFKTIAKSYDLIKLDTNTHLYTSNTRVQDFIGKTFEVIWTVDYKTFANEKKPKKANVVCKNFPHTPDEVKKRHKIIDGGGEFLIFTRVAMRGLIVVLAKLAPSAQTL